MSLRREAGASAFFLNFYILTALFKIVNCLNDFLIFIAAICFKIVIQNLLEIIKCHRFGLFLTITTNRDCSLLFFIITDNESIRNLVDLCLANLVTHLFVSIIDRNANLASSKSTCKFPCIIRVEIQIDRNDFDLLWGNPCTFRSGKP